MAEEEEEIEEEKEGDPKKKKTRRKKKKKNKPLGLMASNFVLQCFYEVSIFIVFSMLVYTCLRLPLVT